MKQGSASTISNELFVISSEATLEDLSTYLHFHPISDDDTPLVLLNFYSWAHTRSLSPRASVIWQGIRIHSWLIAKLALSLQRLSIRTGYVLPWHDE